MESIKNYLAALRNVIAALVVFTGVVAILHFPFAVDAPLSEQEVAAAQKYYTDAYQKPVANTAAPSNYETEYIRVARHVAEETRIAEQVGAFVNRFNLTDRPVLEIGSGQGLLQDVAANYTGLDISPSAERFYHKKFVLGSATALPFPDNSFDGIWSIAVFEHVPNPEQAFFEARRVTRDKGMLFLQPAWNCNSWAAQGYEVRPYSDFNWAGKIIKASIPLRSSAPFRIMTFVPNRIVRKMVAQFGPTRLRYRRLAPNYEKYWVADSDAINSIDSHEAMLWFLSRGDECLNCDDASLFLPAAAKPLIIRVHKQPREHGNPSEAKN